MGEDLSKSTHAPLYVGGSSTDGRAASRFEVINPATEDVFGTAADAGQDGVLDAVIAARHAFDTTEWSRDHAFRRHCLQQLQDGMRKHVARRSVVDRGLHNPQDLM